MTDRLALARLTMDVADSNDAGEALDRVAKGALSLTQSRHAIIAILNEETGMLEVQHGAGDGFSESALGEKLAVAMADNEGVVSYVAASGKVYHSGDVRTDKRYRKLFDSTISEIAVPVRDRFGRVRAVMNVESDAKDAYPAEVIETCKALAGLVAMALERDQSRTHEQALIEIGGDLGKALTEDALIDQVSHVAGEVLRFQACSIFLRDPATDKFILRGSTSRLRAAVDMASYERGEGCTGWVCDTGNPILLHNPQTDPRWRGRLVEFPSEQIASFLCVPIVVNGKSDGAIRVLRRTTENPYLDNRFTDDDLRVMEAIADQVGSRLANVRNVERLLRSERMIAWGELSAKSSHMIGNRVFALKGDVNELGHLLDSGTQEVAQLTELQKSLSSNVQRIEEILTDFRDFVSATRIQRAPVDFNSLVGETVKETFPRRSEVKLDVQLAGDIPEIQADQIKLRRAIGELIENSLHHLDGLPHHPELRITTHVDTSSRRAKDAAIVLEIEDNGAGVPAGDKAQIFMPFYSSRVKGMGLGLSIVKGIVEAHGGQVVETGEPGVGARFVIRLPVADRP
jgi:signal transduction histidine kinase